MLKFKEGQTYICEKSFTTNWIEGNEYKTEYDEISDEYFIYDEFDYMFFDFDINKSKLVFKLKEENKMLKFKKGDIVEITEEDRWFGQKYDIGTRWVVVDTTHMCVIIKDDRQHDGEGTIVKFRVKLIEEENKMIKFKEGQTYICTKTTSSWWTEGKEYEVRTNHLDNNLVIQDDEGTYFDETAMNNIRATSFQLKEEPPMEKEQEKRITDLIDSQPHYKNQGIEPIDLMRKNFSKEELAGFLQGNVLKYMLRYKDKNGIEDLKKAKTYLTWLIEEEEK